MYLFSFQVQEFLSTLEEDDLEVMKKELIAIKEIFITHEEEEPDAASGENGELYSQIQCSTPLCESSNAKTYLDKARSQSNPDHNQDTVLDKSVLQFMH